MAIPLVHHLHGVCIHGWPAFLWRLVDVTWRHRPSVPAGYANGLGSWYLPGFFASRIDVPVVENKT